MQYVRLGRSGLQVSRLALGCMSYGNPQWRPWVLDEAAAQPFFRRAIEAGINFFDTADMYSLGVSEEVTGRALKAYARREEVVIATKVNFPMGAGPEHGRPVAQAHRAGVRREPQAARRRDDRSLPDPPLRSGGADRRDARSAQRPRARRQGALHRRELGIGVAHGERALAVRAARVGAIHLDAEPLQPRLSRGRARDDSALPRGGRRADAVESARARHADAPVAGGRQRAQRRDRARGKRRLLAAALRPCVRSRGGRRRRRRSPRRAASRWPRSASRGCSAGRASRRRSSARRSSSTSRRRSAPSTCSSPRTNARRSKRRTRLTRSGASQPESLLCPGSWVRSPRCVLSPKVRGPRHAGPRTSGRTVDPGPRTSASVPRTIRPTPRR